MDLFQERDKTTNTNIIGLTSVLILMTTMSCNDQYCLGLGRNFENLSCPDGEQCSVDMKDIVGGEWEYLYIFSGFTMPQDISDAIGFDCTCEAIYDPTDLIVLVAHDQILNKIQYDCNILDVFGIMKNGFVKIDSSNSIDTFGTRIANGRKVYVLDFQEYGGIKK